MAATPVRPCASRNLQDRHHLLRPPEIRTELHSSYGIVDADVRDPATGRLVLDARMRYKDALHKNIQSFTPRATREGKT
jgi:hypothetical protein